MMPLPTRLDPELGVVRLCRRCGEEWPLDEEFWLPQRHPRSANDRWHNWCRACRLEVTAISDARRRASAAAPEGGAA